MMKLGQIIIGRTGQYSITKQLHESVWLAMNQDNDNFIVKSANHFRVHNERDVLRKFQHKTPFLRPLLDEIQDPASPPAIVLKYLDDDISHASNKKRLARAEVKYVAHRVLEALSVLHQEGFVHTDIKPSNGLVNNGKDGSRFKEVQLADFGSTVHMDSAHARDGDSIGTPIFRSPEAHLQMRWDTATDIWSFGATLISLLYGEGFHIFKPDVPADHEGDNLKILMKHHQSFGPFPASYDEIANQERRAVLAWVMQNWLPNTMRPFHLTTSREICNEDKEFVLKVMRLDPRDRPSTQELLEDSWFASWE
ncbi:Putative Serine/threonine protein kinase [Penicillium brasilianum]|uniref:Putative Serine/threonine protein kinase n=1 Tax=Penicillium brasilianum TaxID=104259 RepID=A0A0F7U2L6_PENBI|nr:Putative Serine/threonine protein kinase [Penicillium brasilianum]